MVTHYDWMIGVSVVASFAILSQAHAQNFDATLAPPIAMNSSLKSSWDNSNRENDEDTQDKGAHPVSKLRETSILSDVTPYSPGSNNLAIDVGQVFLMGNLANYTNSLGFQAHYTYGVSDLFAFDSSLGYSDHSNGMMSMTTLLTGMRMNLSWYDKIVPYVILGLGFYRPSYVDTTSAPAGSSNYSSISDILFGIHAGPGIDLELNKNLFFGAALTFHQIFGETKLLANGSPFYLGGAYASFLLHAGVTF